MEVIPPQALPPVRSLRCQSSPLPMIVMTGSPSSPGPMCSVRPASVGRLLDPSGAIRKTLKSTRDPLAALRAAKRSVDTGRRRPEQHRQGLILSRGQETGSTNLKKLSGIGD